LTNTGKYNTFWKRLFAGIIDGLVFLPLIIFQTIIEEYFIDMYSRWIFIGFEFFYAICWMLYVVVGHGKYGQTVGKKLLKIKVFDIDEKNLIGYRRAFLRESVWFFVSIAGIIYLIIITQNISSINEGISEKYDDIVGLTSLSWFVVELITMLSNYKRRAVHDFIAGSVVVDLKENEKIVE
jgi:uncharacterized RDD family membrane protein YckC